MTALARRDVLAFRFGRHQLHRAPASAAATAVELLDAGVQDTGTDGSEWALTIRGARPPSEDDLFLAWTIRGAPHAYRRRDAAAVVVATAPYDEADATSRVFDGSKPLRAAGIPVLDALAAVAAEMRDIARAPLTKGDLSIAVTQRMPEPYRRFCRACNAVHLYEQVFRLAVLQAGLELEAGTSPPVLRRIPGLRAAPYRRLAGDADPRFDVIRTYLRFFGPAPAKAIATYLDAPLAVVNAHLPADVEEVRVEGGGRAPAYVLAGDVPEIEGAADRLAGTASGAVAGDPVVRLAGGYDPYLQLRDRETLVPDRSRHKQLWPILGRPGAVLVDGEVAGIWRARTTGGAAARKLRLSVDPWLPLDARLRAAVGAEAERLATHRTATLQSVDVA